MGKVKNHYHDEISNRDIPEDFGAPEAETFVQRCRRMIDAEPMPDEFTLSPGGLRLLMNEAERMTPGMMSHPQSAYAEKLAPLAGSTNETVKVHRDLVWSLVIAAEGNAA